MCMQGCMDACSTRKTWRLRGCMTGRGENLNPCFRLSSGCCSTEFAGAVAPGGMLSAGKDWPSTFSCCSDNFTPGASEAAPRVGAGGCCADPPRSTWSPTAVSRRGGGRAHAASCTTSGRMRMHSPASSNSRRHNTHGCPRCAICTSNSSPVQIRARIGGAWRARQTILLSRSEM